MRNRESSSDLSAQSSGRRDYDDRRTFDEFGNTARKIHYFIESDFHTELRNKTPVTDDTLSQAQVVRAGHGRQRTKPPSSTDISDLERPARKKRKVWKALRKSQSYQRTSIGFACRGCISQIGEGTKTSSSTFISWTSGELLLWRRRELLLA